MVILKSSVLKPFTRVPSGYIEVLLQKLLSRCLVVTLKSSLLKLFKRVPSGYIEVITSNAINKGA